MKPGQLVMLVKTDSTVVKYFAPVGACGEVKPLQDEFKEHVPVNSVVVHFPNHPSNSTSGYWAVPKAWLIPINEPDVDVTEREYIEREETLEMTE